MDHHTIFVYNALYYIVLFTYSVVYIDKLNISAHCLSVCLQVSRLVNRETKAGVYDFLKKNQEFC